MRSTYGENLKLTISGASHAPSIGMCMEGIPAGLAVNTETLQQFLDRRAPGRTPFSTARKEADVPVFESGIQDGVTTGDTITATICNQNVRKGDYDALQYIPRPGHADFTAWMKYGLDFDMSGGGPFSGRMTAPMCIAGGMCKQWLEAMGIRIGAHILRIGEYVGQRFDPITPELQQVQSDFPALDADEAKVFQHLIAEAKSDQDSVGGIIECAITGMPAGIGGPLFGGLDGKIAQIIYSIPAVKSVSFGVGTDAALFCGSEINDEYHMLDGKVRPRTNYCGGILGGITTGLPVLFQVAIKPTPSIAQPQKSVNMKTMEEVTIQINGRHDPCIVPRAVPVVEAAAAIAIYDLILGQQRQREEESTWI